MNLSSAVEAGGHFTPGWTVVGPLSERLGWGLVFLSYFVRVFLLRHGMLCLGAWIFLFHVHLLELLALSSDLKIRLI